MITDRAAHAPIEASAGPGPAEGGLGAMGTPLLQVCDLRIAFGGQPVVDGVSFTVRPGEKLALVGESGSGKSVTALSLLRLLPQAQVSGQALFDTGTGPRDLLTLPERDLLGVRGRQIATIFQEPMTALNPLFSVGDQIAEVIELHQGLSRAQAWARAVDLLASTGIAEPARRAAAYPHQLSGGQRQRAMIAMALACEPQLLLADEPTTALDATVRLQVLDLLDELQRTHGMAVVMITHDLHLVRRFADRVLVMQQGRAVEQGDTETLFQAPRQPYTRQLLDSRPHRDVTESATGTTAAPLMRARGLRVRYPTPLPGLRGWFGKGYFEALKGADFELPVGQTLGVIGESGSGKSTLALAALGLQPCDGELTIQGRHWQGRAAADRPLRRVVQVVFQDPFSSLSPRRTVEETVGEGLGVHHRGLSDAAVREKVQQALLEVGLSETQFPGLLQRYPHEFSGGQRQRLALARALVVDPALLVLDEPTSALDVTIQQQILSLLQHLQRARGLSYLLITHDVEVVAAMAHHVMVLKGGEVVESGAARAVLLTPRSDYTRALLAAAPSLDSLLRPAGG